MARQLRQTTTRLIDMMEMGTLDPRALAEMCLQYMSEADVTDMAQANDLDPNLEEES